MTRRVKKQHAISLARRPSTVAQEAQATRAVSRDNTPLMPGECRPSGQFECYRDREAEPKQP